MRGRQLVFSFFEWTLALPCMVCVMVVRLEFVWPSRFYFRFDIQTRVIRCTSCMSVYFLWNSIAWQHVLSINMCIQTLVLPCIRVCDCISRGDRISISNCTSEMCKSNATTLSPTLCFSTKSKMGGFGRVSRTVFSASRR